MITNKALMNCWGKRNPVIMAVIQIGMGYSMSTVCYSTHNEIWSKDRGKVNTWSKNVPNLHTVQKVHQEHKTWNKWPTNDMNYWCVDRLGTVSKCKGRSTATG